MVEVNHPAQLRNLVAPVEPCDFISNYWGQRPLHAQGTADRFDGLFGWASLNRILNGLGMPSQALKTHREGRSTHPASADAALTEVKKGATLIVEDIDRLDESLGAFLNSFSDEICSPTRFNLYLSAPGRQGYKLHCDTHDFLILQLAGQKHWRIFPVTTDSPLFHQKQHDLVPPREDSLILQCTLQAGDVLYVPRGFWHDATATQEHSLHLTLAIFTRTGIDFLEWLVDELRAEELFRRNLPFITKQEIPETTPSPYEQHLGLLKERLMAIFSPGQLAHEFHRFCVARQQKRLTFQFPSQLSSEKELEGIALSPSFERIPQPSLLSRNEQSGEMELTLPHKIITFSGNTEPVLRFILSNTAFSRTELLSAGGGISWDELTRILHPLVAESFLRTCD